MVGVVLPTLVPRSLNAVAKFSSFSVCMLFVLASSIASLAAVAVARGQVSRAYRRQGRDPCTSAWVGRCPRG